MEDNWNEKDNRNFYNSSNNPYYNQPTHNPYRRENFATASLLFGVLSLMSACTGIFSIPLGAFSILFAVLSNRSRKKMNTMTLTGMIMSAIGIVSGMVLIIYSFVMLPKMMQDPYFQKQMDAVTESLYGESFEDFMKNYYGVELDQ